MAGSALPLRAHKIAHNQTKGIHILMKSQPNHTSAVKPRQESTASTDERLKIAFWMMKYETFLFRTAPLATYQRYTRALDKLFSNFEGKRFIYEFRRADIEDFKQQRLKDGVSPKTVNIELSCIRSFFDFNLRMNADGAFINPARGVRVKMPSKKRRVLDQAG